MMGAKKKCNRKRYERKKAKKKMMDGLKKDPSGRSKAYKKHG